MTKWGFYEAMRPTEIEAILENNPIVFLPWGALEYHGQHNPIGLDSIKAHHLCIDLAKQVGGLVMPAVNLAANLIKSYPGHGFKKHSIEFSEQLIKTICEEYLGQLAEQDVKIIVLLSGHAGEPHLQILKDVAAEFNKKNPDKFCWTFAEFEIVPDSLLVANHSALGETSLQLHYAENTVDLSVLPKDRPITLQLDAVSGEDPRSATASKGGQIAKVFVENATIEIQRLIKKYKSE